MPEVFVDHEGKRLIGPMSLIEALAATEPTAGGVRCAVSVPNSSYVAVQIGERVHFRKLAVQTEQGGTELGTGAWVDPEAGEFVPSQWRPA